MPRFREEPLIAFRRHAALEDVRFEPAPLRARLRDGLARRQHERQCDGEREHESAPHQPAREKHAVRAHPHRPLSALRVERRNVCERQRDRDVRRRTTGAVRRRARLAFAFRRTARQRRGRQCVLVQAVAVGVEEHAAAAVPQHDAQARPQHRAGETRIDRGARIEQLAGNAHLRRGRIGDASDQREPCAGGSGAEKRDRDGRNDHYARHVVAPSLGSNSYPRL